MTPLTKAPNRQLFFPPLPEYLYQPEHQQQKDSSSASSSPSQNIPYQYFDILRNSNWILVNNLSEAEVGDASDSGREKQQRQQLTKYLLFVQNNASFFLDYFLHMRRPWDVYNGLEVSPSDDDDEADGNAVKSLASLNAENSSTRKLLLLLQEALEGVSEKNETSDSFTSRLNHLDPNTLSQYYPKQLQDISKSVFRTFWKMIMEMECLPKTLDRVELWVDLVSVFGYQNWELVRKLTLKWLLIEKHGEIALGERTLDFTNFWSGICDSLKNVSEQVKDLLLGSQSPTSAAGNSSAHEICLFLYDASFSLRALFGVCPILSWTIIPSSKKQQVSSSDTMNFDSPTESLPLLYWIVVVYEFCLEYLRLHQSNSNNTRTSTTTTSSNSTQQEKNVFFPFLIEQTRQNFQSVANIIIGEIFVNTLVTSAPRSDGKSSSLEDLLLDRYFTPLLRDTPREKLKEQLSKFSRKYFSHSLQGLQPVSQREAFLSRVASSYANTFQMLSGATSSFIDSVPTKNSSEKQILNDQASLGLFIAEHDVHFSLVQQIDECKRNGVQTEESADLMTDIIRALRDAHKDKETVELYNMHNPSLEKLQALYPRYAENFLSTCLEYENGNTHRVQQMIESNQLPSELRDLNKFQKGGEPTSSIASPTGGASATSDVASPIPWEQTDVFADNAKVLIGKQYRGASMGKLSEGLKRRIVESIQYDDEYDDTYDAINSYSTAADGDEEESLEKIAQINRGARNEYSTSRNKWKNKDSSHTDRGSRQGTPDNQSADSSGGNRGRGRGRGRGGRGGGRNKGARRRAAKKRMTGFHGT